MPRTGQRVEDDALLRILRRQLEKRRAGHVARRRPTGCRRSRAAYRGPVWARWTPVFENTSSCDSTGTPSASRTDARYRLAARDERAAARRERLVQRRHAIGGGPRGVGDAWMLVEDAPRFVGLLAPTAARCRRRHGEHAGSRCHLTHASYFLLPVYFTLQKSFSNASVRCGHPGTARRRAPSQGRPAAARGAGPEGLRYGNT